MARIKPRLLLLAPLIPAYFGIRALPAPAWHVPAGGQPAEPVGYDVAVSSRASAHDRIHARRQQRWQARREARGWG